MRIDWSRFLMAWQRRRRGALADPEFGETRGRHAPSAPEQDMTPALPSPGLWRIAGQESQERDMPLQLPWDSTWKSAGRAVFVEKNLFEDKQVPPAVGPGSAGGV